MKKQLFGVVAASAALLVSWSSVSAITNGAPDTTHDYVGAMTGTDPGGTSRLCSGSLVAPGVFLTAGHCTVLSNVVVHFGDDLGVGFATEDISFPGVAVRHPNAVANFGTQFDVGVVLFDQGDAVLPEATLAPENYIGGFTHAQLKTFTFETYGYGLSRGATNGNSLPLMSDGIRRGATQTYLNRHNQYLGLSIHTNKGNGGGCFGDSGGPHLLNDFVVSVTSNGDGNCVATDNTQRVDQPAVRNWILAVIAQHNG